MWCDECRADVAAEYSPASRKLKCAHCQSELDTTHLSIDDDSREARSLLERWAEGKLLDTPSLGEGGHVQQEHTEEVEQASPPQTRHSRKVQARKSEQGSARSFRIDGSHPGHSSENPPAKTEAPKSRREPVLHGPHTRPAARTRRDRFHEQHAQQISQPHFPMESVPGSTPSTKRNSFSVLMGQLLAYTGVLGLTVGTAFVIWGYFGGPPGFAPTGWIIATAGQMMLLLGVVTLVSGGMEQTSNEVRTRIETIGERLIRIEQATDHALQGPHTGKARQRRQQMAEIAENEAEEFGDDGYSG
ncbi:hypothetical protein [Calycomorphotria hydatis]|uniref:Uncharacterized protein n=1 Tax=Calycomorphotria hydatis TaxID=2528027 RepID=A0A517T8V8_9PLAN|nr:hypothetical protein [Calycomorphotria hydatis]QDT64788.1 hypothetical protein V22_20300 [Calycomorphotria hydatis]